MYANLIESLIVQVVKEKNSNSEAQHFLYHSRLSAKSIQESQATDALQKIAAEPSVLDNAKDSVILLATSSDFRQLMMELSEITRQMFTSYSKLGDEGVWDRYDFLGLEKDLTMLDYAPKGMKSIAP